MRPRMRHVLCSTIGVVAIGVPALSVIPAAVATVSLPATTTTIEASTTAATYGTPIVFTVNTHATVGTGSPAAKVQIRDGGVTIASVQLSGGVATFTTSKLQKGPHSIDAVFAGGTRYAASQSAALDVSVSGVPTTTTIDSDLPNTPGPPEVDGKTTITFTATVTGQPPVGGTPQGAFVDFFDLSEGGGGPAVAPVGTSAEGTPGTLLGTAPLKGGVATFTTNELPGGFHSVGAHFRGGTIYDESFSNLENFFIGVSQLSIDLNADKPLDSDFLYNSVWGETVTFTADLTKAGVPFTPGQPLGFYERDELTNTYTLLTSKPIVAGTSTWSTATLPVGFHWIDACIMDGSYVYQGCSEVGINVGQSETTTVLTSNPDPAVKGTPVTLTAQVDAVAPGTGHPVSAVSFFDGKNLLATVPLQPGGTASYTTTLSVANAHNLTAVFVGGTNFVSSYSNTIDVF